MGVGVDHLRSSATAGAAEPALGAPAHAPPVDPRTSEPERRELRLTRPDRLDERRHAAGRREVIRKRDALFRRALVAADLIALCTALAVAAALSNGLALGAVAAVPAFVLAIKARGLYDRDEHLLHKSTLDEVPALFTLASLTVMLLWLVGDTVVEGGLGRGQGLAVWLSLIVLLVGMRKFARTLASRRAPGERCMLVGNAAVADYVADKLAISPVKAELVAITSLPPAPVDPGAEPPPSSLGPILDEKAVDRVIIAGGQRDNLLFTIRELRAEGVKVSVLPGESRVAGSSVELDDLGGITLLGMRRFEISRSSRLVKRSFDIVGASIGLLLALPVLAVAAVAIRVESSGPALFRQRRVGRDSETFEMLKLRSMREDADARKCDYEHLNDGREGLFKISQDPRVTRVGRFLRRFQLDELPQLINVLRGDMSLVGPRPLIEVEDSQIEGFYRRRLDVPPGITGHWQVLGSSRTIPLREMVKLDYLYVANWSLWGDIRLLLRTVLFVLGRRSV